MATWKARFRLHVFAVIKMELSGKNSVWPCVKDDASLLEARFHGKGSSPCQCIDTTRKAIECATTLLLTVFI